MLPKWCFVVEISRSEDYWSGSHKKWGRGLDSSLESYDQMVKVGGEWVDLESVLLGSCQVARWAYILLDPSMQAVLAENIKKIWIWFQFQHCRDPNCSILNRWCSIYIDRWKKLQVQVHGLIQGSLTEVDGSVQLTFSY